VPFLFLPSEFMTVKKASPRSLAYRSDCRDCPRLAIFLDEVKIEYPEYFCKPVPPFGVQKPALLIVGLAPGLHGANRTGRPFTGDYAGGLLYSTLHKFGFADRPVSVDADDGMTLIDCRITNAVKCLPPQNKPEGAEVRICNQFLKMELAETPRQTAILALGGIAHGAVLMAAGVKPAAHKFGHAAKHHLASGHVLFDSYHCSRYNTNTKRLTEGAFHDVFAAIRAHLNS
jgi:uracil-DNA glycosylase